MCARWRRRSWAPPACAQWPWPCSASTSSAGMRLPVAAAQPAAAQGPSACAGHDKRVGACLYEVSPMARRAEGALRSAEACARPLRGSQREKRDLPWAGPGAALSATGSSTTTLSGSCCQSAALLAPAACMLLHISSSPHMHRLSGCCTYLSGCMLPGACQSGPGLQAGPPPSGHLHTSLCHQQQLRQPMCSAGGALACLGLPPRATPSTDSPSCGRNGSCMLSSSALGGASACPAGGLPSSC